MANIAKREDWISWGIDGFPRSETIADNEKNGFHRDGMRRADFLSLNCISLFSLIIYFVFGQINVAICGNAATNFGSFRHSTFCAKTKAHNESSNAIVRPRAELTAVHKSKREKNESAYRSIVNGGHFSRHWQCAWANRVEEVENVFGCRSMKSSQFRKWFLISFSSSISIDSGASRASRFRQ